MPSDDNPTGCFLHTFEVEEHEVLVKRCFLQFDGVDSAFYCWLNGSLVGGYGSGVEVKMQLYYSGKVLCIA